MRRCLLHPSSVPARLGPCRPYRASPKMLDFAVLWFALFSMGKLLVLKWRNCACVNLFSTLTLTSVGKWDRLAIFAFDARGPGWRRVGMTSHDADRELAEPWRDWLFEEMNIKGCHNLHRLKLQRFTSLVTCMFTLTHWVTAFVGRSEQRSRACSLHAVVTNSRA